MRRNLLVFLALTTSALLACGGSQPAANPPAPSVDVDASAPSDDTSAEAGAPTGEAADAGATPTVAATDAPKFDDLPKDKKVEVMATKVVPEGVARGADEDRQGAQRQEVRQVRLRDLPRPAEEG